MRRDGSTRYLAASAVAFLIMLGAAEAQAFCRTTTCDPSTEDCTPPAGEPCITKGLPLYWPVKCTSYDLDKDTPPGISFEQFESVAALSFGAWTKADCANGVLPSIQTTELPSVSGAQVCYNQAVGNVNAILFQLDKWPYSDALHTLALTTVTFNTQTGEIYDADMEINGTLQVDAGMPITVSDTNVGYDLQSIMTHEAGHYYGLAHAAPLPGQTTCSVTMCAMYNGQSTAIRTLQPDDIAGICEIYPQARAVSGTCDPTPRHGFGAACGDPSDSSSSGCCSTATTPARTSGRGMAAVAAALVGWVLLRSRRRR